MSRTVLGRVAGVAVVAALSLAGGQVQATPAVSAPLNTTTLRVLTIGDSITRGIGSPTLDGYRAYLTAYMVTVGQISGAQMVGGLADGRGPQPQHEGHGGWRIDQLTTDAATWTTTYDPDVVLITAGVNDALQGATGLTMSNRMRALIGAIVNADAAVRVIVSEQVAPWGSLERDAASVAVRQYNALLPDVVGDAGPRVTLARMAMAIPSGMLADGTHPSDEGYERMAWVWWTCLGPILATDGITRTGKDPLPMPLPQSTLCLD